MKKSLLLLLFIPVFAFATDVNLSWTNATKNTDGTDIVASGPGALATTTILWSVCDPNDEVIVTPGLDVTIPTTIPGNSESTTIGVGTPGRWCFVGYHTNEQGISSDFSGVAIKDVYVTPEPPIGLIIDPANLIVYSISQSKDVVILLAQGWAPEGTACDGTMTVNGHYRVPVDVVTWAGSSRPPVVFALCQ